MATVKINSKGFALAEVGVALPILTIAIAGVFTVVYLCVVQAWLKDAGEEAALCVAEDLPAHFCKKELMNKTRAALPIGEFTRLIIEKHVSKIVVKYSYRAVRLTIENEISLRLPVSKSAVGNL